MNLRSAWAKETGQTREDTRLTVLGAMTPANPVQVRSGILPGSYGGDSQSAGFWMTGATAMSATIHEGRAVIQGDSTQGAYPVTLPEQYTVTFADGNAQFDRIDLVVIRVYDDTYDNSQTFDAVIEVIQGGAATGAVIPPPTPPLSLPLYQVYVPAGTSAGNGGIDWSSRLTDLRTVTVSIGGILPSYQDSGAAGCYPGQYQDAGSLQRWSGSAWVAYPHQIGGIAPNGTLATGGYTGQYRDGGNGVLQRWSGSSWLPAVPGPVFTITVDAGSTSSATYVATLGDTSGVPFSVNFTAPPSGSVLVTLGAAILVSNNSTANAFMSGQISQGSTVVVAATDDPAVCGTGPLKTSCMATNRISSLTPGVTYTVTSYYRVTDSAQTAWFDNRTIRVDPVL